MAHIIESAIGKSYPEPSLRLEAGARFMTMCFAGKRKPVFLMAERMRSFASLTAASGKPTISNAGKPFEISVSTHTISFIAAKVSGVPSIAAQMYASVEFKFKAVKMNTIRY